MKLIFENWKRFLVLQENKETAELENKFFGNSGEIAKLVYDLYSKAKATLFSQGSGPADILNYHDYISEAIQQEVKNKTGKEIQNAGRGQFRATYIYDNDLVIKIDVSVDGSGKKMNQEDQKFGSRSGFDVFPRSYKFDPNYNWVVLERILEINNIQSINSFFPNNELKGSYQLLPILKNCIKYKVANFERNEQEAEIALGEISDLASGLNTTPQKIINEYNKLPLFNQVCSAVFTFKMDVDDSIKPFNCGIGSDDRFVILDSSVKESIKTGISGLSQQHKDWAKQRREKRQQEETEQTKQSAGVTRF